MSKSSLELKALEAVLRSVHSSWSVEIVGSGEKAMEKCKACKFTFDVVVLGRQDAGGPDGGLLHGPEMAALIRAHELSQQRPAWPTIIVGLAAESQAAEETLISAGCNEVWRSPLPSPMAPQVTDALHQLFKDRSRGPGAAARRLVTWK